MGKPWHVFLPGQVLSDCPGVSQFWRDGVMKHGKKPTVVVINDDATQRATLIGLLEGAGCRGLEFEGAEEALGVLTAQPPELVVTDLHMPGLDGWRLCRLLRSPEFAICNHIPILVVSATFSGDEPRRLTAGMGANAFLPFPVEGDAFKGLVVQLLAGQVPPVAPRVLVVEDDPDLAAAVCEGFVLRGCQVAVAQSGEEARQALREGAPDTVVLDYHLPDLKGDRLLAELQGLESGPAVVMMTGDVNPELALRFVKMGARAFVHKPFEVEYLISLCDSAWRERCLLRVEHLLEQRTRQLRESDERFRVMADNAPAMMLLVDTRGGVHQVNQAAREFCGQRCEPSPGLQLAQVLKCLHATEDPRGCGFGAQCCRCPFLHMAAEAIQSGRCRSRVEARLRVMANGRPTAVSLLASAARVEVSAQPMALLCLENVSAL
ncbi:MAG TPA: response regulator, partial [Candidatus Sulfotelmatobacter sp.]|nr:response regulator [Candidatus Sulfotelmatobacter sp.]